MTALHDNIEARFPPAGLTENGWGLVNTNKTPMEGGAPEWHRDFEGACRWHEHLVKTGAPINWRGLGFCFGGISNHSVDPATDEWHGNLSVAEAEARGKPAGALYRRPGRIACIDYDHVIDPATGLLRDDLPPERAQEINIFAAVFPTEVSMSGTGLHVVFEKPDGWPSFGKIVKDGREVFSEAGYVIFTGNWWKGAKTLEDPDALAEIKGVALGRLMEIVRQEGNGTEVLPGVGTPAGEVRQTKSPVEPKGFCPIGITPEQFAEWKRRYTAVDICMRNGYRCEGDRLAKPGSKHTAGVMIQEYGEYVYSHHANDPLGDGNHHDAYDCLKILECGGSDGEAAKQILRDLGLGKETPKPAPAPVSAPAPEPKKEPPKSRTLGEIADAIGQRNAEWVVWKNKGEPDEEAYIDLAAWWMIWQDETHMVSDADRKDGVYWFDGLKWRHLAYAKDFRIAMGRALIPHPYVKRISGWDNIARVADLHNLMFYSIADDPSKYIYCADGSRVEVDDEGVHVSRGDPAKEVWLHGIAVSGDDVYRDLASIDFETVCGRFPEFCRMMNVCDAAGQSDRTHLKLMTTMAASVLYSYLVPSLKMPPLDAVFWLYDTNLSRTGKSTHARMLVEAFGDLATRINSRDLMSENARTGNLVGAALAWVDEASDCEIQDTGLFKSLPSGTAMLRKMYCEPVKQTYPVIIVATANGAPRIPPYKVSEALQRRLIPFKYTEQHLPTSSPGCSDEEAYRAIINLGLWGCCRLIRQQKSGGIVRDAWMLKTEIEDVERMLETVAWVRTLESMLETAPGSDISITTLRRSLVAKLADDGRCEAIPLADITSSAPGHLKDYNLPADLQSDRAFRSALKNRILKVARRDDGVPTEYVEYQCATPDLSSRCTRSDRFVLRGVAFRNQRDIVVMDDPQKSF